MSHGIKWQQIDYTSDGMFMHFSPVYASVLGLAMKIVQTEQC